MERSYFMTYLKGLEQMRDKERLIESLEGELESTRVKYMGNCFESIGDRYIRMRHMEINDGEILVLVRECSYIIELIRGLR